MHPHPMRKNTTAAALAKRLGVNIKTVYKYTALPRADYLAANKISECKPWEAMGMSRATWYRKGKPEPEQLEHSAHQNAKEVA
jgi:isopentenyldiphosphate isomerase